MGTTVKLDTKAMEALFPEGSEARVELQQAVIQNFADRHLRVPDLSELKQLAEKRTSELNKTWEDIVTKSLHQHYGTSPTGARIYGRDEKVLREYVKTKLVPLLGRYMDDHMHEMVRAQMETEGFGTNLEKRIEYLAEQRMKRMIDDLGEKHFNEISQLLADQFSGLMQAIFDKQMGKPNEPA